MIKYKYIFPYDVVKNGERVVIVGAGVVGACFVNQILESDYCKIEGIIDKSYLEKRDISGIEVSPYKDIEKMNYDHIIIATTPKHWMAILNDLICVHVPLQKCIMDTYEYNGDTAESIVIGEIFKILGKEKFSYIDAGACHPHIKSNTMSFYMNGLRGINIEPQEFLKTEFEIYRPEDINIFMGIGVESGEALFYESVNPQLSTFSIYGKEYSEKYHDAIYIREKTIKLVTLNEIVNMYCDGIFPELLDIDIEGLDEEVLEKTDFSKSSPLVICAEGSTIHLNRILGNKECEAGGYIPYCRIESNTIYVRKDIYKELLCL